MLLLKDYYSWGSQTRYLAILCAEVTIVDISEENMRYVLEVAKATDVKVASHQRIRLICDTVQHITSK
jgi:predicted metallopeptidase